MLRRFLLGSQRDVGKAAHLLTGNLVWRHQERVEHILDEEAMRHFEQQALRHYPYAIHGTDRDGRCVYIERVGSSNVAEALALGEAKLLRHHIYMNEKCMRISDQRVVIMDMQGLSRHHLSSAGMAMVKKFIGIDERHYPESLHRLYIVNSPWVLSVAWSTVSGWLDPHTASKIQILGADFEKTLCKNIPPEALPAFLGGTCKCKGGCVPLPDVVASPGWF